MFFPVNGDPYYSNVSLLLPMTGANNSTTFTDYSSSPKTITRTGDTKISTTQSKWGNGAGYFDGTGDYLSITQSAEMNLGTDNFTIEGWIYNASRPTDQVIFQIGDDLLTSGLSFGIMSSGLVFAYNAARYIGAGSASLNTWNHLALVRSGTSLKGYLNGVSVANSVTHSNNLSGNYYIGVELYNSVLYTRMNGYLQDIRVTKGVARYAANFAVPASHLPMRLPELPVRSIIQPHQFHTIVRLGL